MTLRKLVTLTGLILAGMSGNIGIDTAQAHQIVIPDVIEKKALKTQIKLRKRNLYHARGVIAAVKKQKRVSWNEAVMLRNHRWLKDRAEEELDELRARLAYSRRPPHYNDWLCIHSHEGPWNDPNAPYYGGLQMDWDFMEDYGSKLLREKGTADNWTPLEQMWVAERAYASGRGFYPWPNTARECGLI